MINGINIALSGLHAATSKINASASNIANLQTAGRLDNTGPKPYVRLESAQTTASASGEATGVRAQIVPSNRPFIPSYNPGSPFANTDGLIGLSNINIAEEAVDIKIADLVYKANIKTLEASVALSDELLNMFDNKDKS